MWVANKRLIYVLFFIHRKRKTITHLWPHRFHHYFTKYTEVYWSPHSSYILKSLLSSVVFVVLISTVQSNSMLHRILICCCLLALVFSTQINGNIFSTKTQLKTILTLRDIDILDSITEKLKSERLGKHKNYSTAVVFLQYLKWPFPKKSIQFHWWRSEVLRHTDLDNGPMELSHTIYLQLLVRTIIIIYMKWVWTCLLCNNFFCIATAYRKLIVTAMHTLMYAVGTPISGQTARRACVSFRPRQSSDRSYLKIIYGDGCSTTVSRS